MTENVKRERILEVAMGVLAGLAPLVVYLITLPPSITFDDSGQIITAAAKLGISHPSGYPLASLVGQAFTLVPFGSMAWRVNLASAGAATACCVMLFFLLRGIFLDMAPGKRVAAAASAAAAALAFAFSRTFWSQAIIAEAYALNALMLATVLYAAFNFVRSKDPRWGYLAAFVGGLALGAHTSSTLITIPVTI
ncbi:MAG: DUF2723 domain-containing protein, partial [Candidatus Zixiibacteriota bacterium]